MCAHEGSFGIIWVHLGSFGIIYLESFGISWHLGLSGMIPGIISDRLGETSGRKHLSTCIWEGSGMSSGRSLGRAPEALATLSSPGASGRVYLHEVGHILQPFAKVPFKLRFHGDPQGRSHQVLEINIENVPGK